MSIVLRYPIVALVSNQPVPKEMLLIGWLHEQNKNRGDGTKGA